MNTAVKIKNIGKIDSITRRCDRRSETMAVPLDAIRAIHNAFRRDIKMLDESANLAAHKKGNLDLILQRYNFFNDVLVWHASGEEKFVFPVIEKVAPLISQSYEQDHRGLDELSTRLSEAVTSNDPVEITRVTAAFKFHLDIHLLKEDTQLYRIYDERVPLPEQVAINANMAKEAPQERYPEFVTWLISLADLQERENMTRIWQQAMPVPVFTKIVTLIQAAAGDDWAKIIGRVPELKSLVKSQVD
jgi:iron-sulfur cluster repair protein YtfE (RIC family)